MIGLLLLVVSTLHAAPQAADGKLTGETYVSVAIAADGQLRIVTSDHRTIVVSKSRQSKAGESFGAQTAFDEPLLSEDHRAAGATALFANCCTSYDIPLQLVVYSNGRTHRFEGGLAIFDWHFSDGGRRVVFSQQTVHFGCFVHWELRDVASERRLAQVDVPEPCGQIPHPPAVTIPPWVTGSVSGFK